MRPRRKRDESEDEAEGMTIQEMMGKVRAEVGKVVLGQEPVIDQLFTAVLAEGHVLLEGVPGVAKTLVARALARCIGGQFRRVQCTPDLMPADITGTNVFDMQQRTFRLVKGPVFTNVLLVDEINRTPPKTQSALLQAMQERCVTIDGVDHALAGLFFVAATQNPIEYEGTYPLPEAQLDRFLMKVEVSYPAAETEQSIVRLHLEGRNLQDLEQAGVSPVVGEAELAEARAELARQTVREEIVAYVTELVRRTRESPHTALGASPRAAVHLMQCAQIVAAANGRDFVTPDDVQAVVPPVICHRLILRPEAETEGLTAERLLDSVVSAVPVPR
ncbi:MAG: MoxR family ATPase [Armatimonadetes bacterium]|nr:MoxR family ATPase [Armatimonadota bacterium]